MSNRLYQQYPKEINEYIHHFIDEENKHSAIFGRFCNRYAGKIYQLKQVNFAREYETGEEEFLFFAKIVIFEEFVDYFNVKMSKDESLNPLVRQINAYHHADEARHLAFGRKMIASLYDYYQSNWSAATKAGIEQYLLQYLSMTWRSYYNPAMYQDAGFTNSYAVYQSAFNAQTAQAFRASLNHHCLKPFYHNQIIQTPSESMP